MSKIPKPVTVDAAAQSVRKFSALFVANETAEPRALLGGPHRHRRRHHDENGGFFRAQQRDAATFDQFNNDPNSAFMFIPALREGGLQSGFPLSERRLVIEIEGDTFARRKENKLTLFQCISFGTPRAPSFAAALWKMWTEASVEANATRVAITFFPTSDFVGLQNGIEFVTITFGPRCFMSGKPPNPATMQFAVTPGGGLPPPPATLLSKPLTTTVDAVTGGSMMVASSFGGPASAASVLRSNSILNIAQCDGDANSLTFFEHPTGWRLGLAWVKDDISMSDGQKALAAEFFGAVVANTLIAIGIGFVHFFGLVLVRLWFLRKRDKIPRHINALDGGSSLDSVVHRADGIAHSHRSTLQDAMADVAFPGKLFSVVGLFFPVIVKTVAFLALVVSSPMMLGLTLLCAVPWTVVTFVGVVVVLGPFFNSVMKKRKNQAAMLAAIREARGIPSNGRGRPPRPGTTRAAMEDMDDADEIELSEKQHWRKATLGLDVEDGPTPFKSAKAAAARAGGRLSKEQRLQLKKDKSLIADDGCYATWVRPRAKWRDRPRVTSSDKAEGEGAAAEGAAPPSESSTSSDDEDDGQQHPDQPGRASSRAANKAAALKQTFAFRFTDRFGDLFDEFHDRAHYTNYVDICATSGICFLDGYTTAKAQECPNVIYIVLAIVCLYFLFLIVKRPWLSRVWNVAFVFMSAFQVALAVMAVVQLTTDIGIASDQLLNAINVMVLVVQFILFIKAFLDVAHLIFSLYERRKFKQANLPPPDSDAQFEEMQRVVQAGGALGRASPVLALPPSSPPHSPGSANDFDGRIRRRPQRNSSPLAGAVPTMTAPRDGLLHVPERIQPMTPPSGTRGQLRDRHVSFDAANGHRGGAEPPRGGANASSRNEEATMDASYLQPHAAPWSPSHTSGSDIRRRAVDRLVPSPADDGSPPATELSNRRMEDTSFRHDVEDLDAAALSPPRHRLDRGGGVGGRFPQYAAATSEDAAAFEERGADDVATGPVLAEMQHQSVAVPRSSHFATRFSLPGRPAPLSLPRAHAIEDGRSPAPTVTVGHAVTTPPPSLPLSDGDNGRSSHQFESSSDLVLGRPLQFSLKPPARLPMAAARPAASQEENPGASPLQSRREQAVRDRRHQLSLIGEHGDFLDSGGADGRFFDLPRVASPSAHPPQSDWREAQL